MTYNLKKTVNCDVPAKVEGESFVRPRYRVKTEEHAFELFVVMPGVSKKEVNISLEENRLTITGTPHRDVPASWRVVHEELARDAYRLELELHRDIDEGGISAKVEEGILVLRLPLKEAAKPRLIAIK